MSMRKEIERLKKDRNAIILAHYYQPEEIQEAESGLKFSQAFFESDGIPCEEHLLIRGLEPGEDLVHFAEENDIDEIVIGIKRRSKVGKFLFGSNAQYVILEAPCPVLTVK